MNTNLLLLCCGLTVLEMVAAIFAEKTGWPWVVAGVITFVGLFFLYKLSLSAGSLTLVTIGWIFTSQIAAVAVDRFVFDKTITKWQFIGMVVILTGVAIMCIPASKETEWKSSEMPSELSSSQDRSVAVSGLSFTGSDVGNR